MQTSLRLDRDVPLESLRYGTFDLEGATADCIDHEMERLVFDALRRKPEPLSGDIIWSVGKAPVLELPERENRPGPRRVSTTPEN